MYVCVCMCYLSDTFEYFMKWRICFVLSVDDRVYGLAVNPEEDKLYISDYGDRKIVVTRLNGSGNETLIDGKSFTGKPHGLAVDLNRR